MTSKGTLPGLTLRGEIVTSWRKPSLSPAPLLHSGEDSFQGALRLGRIAEALAGGLPEGHDCLLKLRRQLSAESRLVWCAGLLVNGGL